MQSATVVSALNEAELKRQRDRMKNKDRKKRRSGGARKSLGGTAATEAADTADAESFIPFSNFADDDAQAEMDDIDRHQQQIVDENAEAEAQAQPEPEPAEEEAAAEEEEDAEMQDAEEAAEEVDVEQNVEEAGEEEEEELLQSSDDEASEAAEDDSVVVDVVNPDASDDDAVAEDADEDAAPRASPTMSPLPSLFTTPLTTRTKKRTSAHTDAASATPSVRLSTFAFTAGQVEFDAVKREYLLKFRAGETLTFHGSVTFAVEEGYIDIHGHTFNPRSKRQRLTTLTTAATATPSSSISSSPSATTITSQFNAHSWQWQPHALLSMAAKSSSSSSMDEFVAVVRLRACSSRFSPQRLAAWTTNDAVAMIEAGAPSAVTNPYEAAPSTQPNFDEPMSTPAKAPASKAKNKRAKKVSAVAVAAPPAPGFVRLNIPGFTPVLFSDDDFRASAAEVAASSVGAEAVPAPRFMYGSLSIPSEWESSVQTMLLPQVPTTHAVSEADEPAHLSKAQASARRAHLQSLREQILQAGLRILVYGARNCGKSTLLTFLTNQCLNKFSKVLYLDLDVGQSSLNPPGMIAMHEVDAPILSTSPHVLTGRGAVASRMVWSYFVGDVTQQHDPAAILHATQAAVRMYETQYGPSSSNPALCPLLVNTQGWITGLGLELLRHTVCDIVQPVYVIEVKAEKEESELAPMSAKKKHLKEEDADQVIGDIAHPHQLYIFRRTTDAGFASSLLTSMAIASAPRIRQLQLLSYFTAGSAPAAALPLALSAYASLFSSLQPYRVPFNRVAIDVVGMDAGRDYDPASVLSILNASIVGLCVRPARDQRTELTGKKSGVRLLSSRLTTPPFTAGTSAPPLDVCLGLGVVRGVDLAAGCFYLLTPLSAVQLQRVNLLQKGKLELPNMAFGVDSHGAARLAPGDKSAVASSSVALPYLSTSSLSAGSGLGSREMSSRHNIQRKRLN